MGGITVLPMYHVVPCHAIPPVMLKLSQGVLPLSRCGCHNGTAMGGSGTAGGEKS